MSKTCVRQVVPLFKFSRNPILLSRTLALVSWKLCVYIYMRVIIDTTLSLSLYLLRVSKRQKGRGKRDAWKRESVYAKILTTFPWWKIAPRTSPIGNPSYKSADTTNSTPLNKTKSRSFHRSKTREGNAHTTNRWSRLGRGLMRRTKKMSTRSADTALFEGYKKNT